MLQALKTVEKGRKYSVDKLGGNGSLAADLSVKKSLEGVGYLAADAVTYATQHGLVRIDRKGVMGLLLVMTSGGLEGVERDMKFLSIFYFIYEYLNIRSLCLWIT